MEPELVHVDGLECIVHPLTDLSRLNTEVFRCKGHIVLNNVCDYLIIGVLEHHAYGAAHLEQIVLIGGVNAVN